MIFGAQIYTSLRFEQGNATKEVAGHFNYQQVVKLIWKIVKPPNNLYGA